MSQKCCLYAHFEWLTGPALRNVISDEVSGDKVSMHYLVLLNENILFIAMISCRLWLYTGPVVANFFSTFFLATDRTGVSGFLVGFDNFHHTLKQFVTWKEKRDERRRTFRLEKQKTLELQQRQK